MYRASASTSNRWRSRISTVPWMGSGLDVISRAPPDLSPRTLPRPRRLGPASDDRSRAVVALELAVGVDDGLELGHHVAETRAGNREVELVVAEARVDAVADAA